MRDVPPLFLQHMQRLLGEEYPAFQSSYRTPAVTGLRANTLKISPQELQARLPYDLAPLPWSEAGFWVRNEPAQDVFPPGKHPYHAAGLYYLQDPSAMAVVELLDPQPGERVLDLCAAPGGKATHIAARMQNQGVLLANETHPQRAWELAENLERWGARNAAITQEAPRRLADDLEGFFDKVLVDAPCSGEGMFRKSESARVDWSPDLVQSCALRQSTILEDAVRLVRPGGRLIYSTCTFNPQENEATLASLLQRHPNFTLALTPHFPGFAPGRPDWVETDFPELSRAVRLWPHLAPGEGHFVALLQRNEEQPGEAPPRLSQDYAPYKAARHHQPAAHRSRDKSSAPVANLFHAFCRAHLSTSSMERLQGALHLNKSYLYSLPEGMPDLHGLRVIHPGWWLGSIHTGQTGQRFEPSHALAMGLEVRDARQALDLDSTKPAVLAYLRGEVLDWQGQDGWVLVAVEGYPLGWGKATAGRLKNAYPRGLRWV